MAQEARSPPPKASAGSPSWSQQAPPELRARPQAAGAQQADSVWQWLPQGSGVQESPRCPSTGASARGMGLQFGSTGRLSEPGASSSSSTPLRGPASARKPSAGGSAPLSARANYESALLSAVRRQIESFEEKVGGQISTLRCQQQRDRLREAAFSRLEEKMGALEGVHPKLEQRLAELTGNFKGLSDEMQAQIRRVDLVDDRLWEWRHQLEEEFQQKYTDFEQSIHKVCSGVRVMASANEEGQKSLCQRVLALEAEARERLSQPKLQARDWVLLRERLDALEGRCRGLEAAVEEASASMLGRMETSAREVDTMEEAANSALLGLLERRVGDIGEKQDRAHQDLREAHGKLAVQEEQLRSMRTLLETGEERNRALLDRIERSDLEGKLEQLRQATLEEARHRMEHRERLELLARQLDAQDQAHEELRHSHLRMPRESSSGMLLGAAASPADAQSWQCRLMDVEAHLGVIQTEFEALREDSDLAPRVGELVSSLKEVMPKVVAHDHAIRELQAGCQDSGAGGASAVGTQGSGERLEELRLLREKVGALDTEGAEVQGKLAEHEVQLLELSRRQAELQALKEEAHKLQPSSAMKEPVQKLMHMASSSQEAASCVLAEFHSLVRGLQDSQAPGPELQQELRQCTQMSVESRELAASVLGELSSLRRELQPTAAGAGGGADGCGGSQCNEEADSSLRHVSFAGI